MTAMRGYIRREGRDFCPGMWWRTNKPQMSFLSSIRALKLPTKTGPKIHESGPSNKMSSTKLRACLFGLWLAMQENLMSRENCCAGKAAILRLIVGKFSS
jgi:hypothetical protein